MLNKVRQLLDDSDSEVVELIDEMMALVEGTRLARLVGSLSAAAGRFDFDAALDELKKIEEAL